MMTRVAPPSPICSTPLARVGAVGPRNTAVAGVISPSYVTGDRAWSDGRDRATGARVRSLEQALATARRKLDASERRARAAEREAARAQAQVDALRVRSAAASRREIEAEMEVLCVRGRIGGAADEMTSLCERLRRGFGSDGIAAFAVAALSRYGNAISGSPEDAIAIERRRDLCVRNEG